MIIFFYLQVIDLTGHRRIEGDEVTRNMREGMMMYGGDNLSPYRQRDLFSTRPSLLLSPDCNISIIQKSLTCVVLEWSAKTCITVYLNTCVPV